MGKLIPNMGASFFYFLAGLYMGPGGGEIKRFGDGEGNQRREKKKKEKIWGEYNFWQYQIIKID